MSRLLRAGYVRLFKNKLLWASIAVTVVMGVIAGHTKYTEIFMDGYRPDLADALFSGSYMAAIAAAVISPMFSGTEYSDGTIRNKIIAGHKRAHIYFLNLILSFTASVLAMLGFLLPYAAICLVVLGKSSVPASTLLLYFCLSVLTLLAVCAIFNAVTMLLARKAAAAVACLLLIAAGFMSTMTIYYRLEAPETHPVYDVDSSGKMEAKEVPNPHYVTGVRRQIYETALNLLPLGQLLQILNLNVREPGLLVIYSAAVILIFTGGGTVVFQRKDIK